MTFPLTGLGIVVEMAFGADLSASPATYTWTDVTEWHYGGDPIRITRGYGDESDNLAQGSMNLVLNNTDGRWNPLLATGPYYGQLGLDTPIRVRINPGVAVVNDVRFTGYISELNPSWDNGPDDARVRLRADSILRRAERSNEARSCLTRMILGEDPIAYWPLEDGSDAASGAPALTTHREMRGARVVEFASVDGPAGSGQLPLVPVTAGLVGQVPPSTSTAWAVHFLFRGSATATGIAWLASIATGGATVRWEVRVDTPFIALYGYDAGGAEVYNYFLGTADNFDGEWHSIMIRASLSGGNMTMYIGRDGEVVNVTTRTGTSYPIKAVSVRNNQFTNSNPVDEVWLGHVAVFDRLWTEYSEAWQAAGAALGEEAADRFERVAAEEGLHQTNLVGATDDQTLGPQQTAKVMDVWREIAATDGGILCDSLDGRAQYIARSELTDRAVDDTTIWATLSVADGQVYLPFDPAYDDQQYLNDVTASRPKGASARYTETDTQRGVYQGGISVNPASDDQLYSLAAWRVFQSQLAEFRHPRLTLSFTGSPDLIPSWLSANGGLAGRFVVTSGLTGMAPDDIDLIVVGYVETISAEDYTVTVNTTPSRRYRFGVLDDSVRARLDTAGAQLASGVSATATSLSVSTTTGPVWITTAAHPSQFPFDIRVAGEDMTVTAITGSSSPQTFTVARSINGVVKAQAAGAAVNVRYPLYLGI